MRFVRSVLAVVVVVAGLSACSGSSGGEPSDSARPRSSSPLPTSSPPSSTPALTADEQAAVDTYLKFVAAGDSGARNPAAVTDSVFASLAIDPALGNELDYLSQLQTAGLAFRGDPPQSRVRSAGQVAVSSGHRLVRLIDCPTVSSTWRPIYVASGQPGKTVAPQAPPPWRSTVEIVFEDGRWLVRSVQTDSSRTCEG